MVMNAFQKLPLYNAKQDTLKLGVELVNAQAKSIRELFELIKTQTAEIKGSIQHNSSLLKSNTLSESEKQAITNELRNNVDLYVQMQSLESQLTPFIGSLVECKNRILSISKSNGVDKLFVSSSFNANFSRIRKDIPVAFFSSKTYEQMKKTETAFETVHLNQQKMLSFRSNVAGALLATLFFVSVATMLAVGLALALFVNPIAGFAILGLTAAFVIYCSTRFERDYMRLVEHVTTIDKEIDLNGSAYSLSSERTSLFHELDQLVEFKNNILSKSDTTVNKEAAEILNRVSF